MPTVPLPGTSNIQLEELEPCRFTDLELWEFHCNYIKAFLDCPNWKCPECGTINFGRNKSCPYCMNKGKDTPRPAGVGVELKWKAMGNL